ncbi:MAG: hypothetical protein OXN84_16430, partial [Albidovulum sp.]|nr:hypothetical protein [Albidovulum sp.]
CASPPDSQWRAAYLPNRRGRVNRLFGAKRKNEYSDSSGCAGKKISAPNCEVNGMPLPRIERFGFMIASFGLRSRAVDYAPERLDGTFGVALRRKGFPELFSASGAAGRDASAESSTKQLCKPS